MFPIKPAPLPTVPFLISHANGRSSSHAQQLEVQLYPGREARLVGRAEEFHHQLLERLPLKEADPPRFTSLEVQPESCR